MKFIISRFIFASYLLLFSISCSSQKKNHSKSVAAIQSKDLNSSLKNTKPFFPPSVAQEKWVDSMYNQLTFDERLGQLFMVAAYSNKDTTHIKSIEKLIKESKIGGLIFFQGGPVRQSKLTNRFQKLSRTPLFIGIDAEWGLSMRLDSTYRYPWNMTLGAIRDTKLIEKLGVKMGLESKRLGIHFNFAPVLDINTNPRNPIIGFRSFGENKENVTEDAIALMKGVQSQGVFSTGKHFPGHGDTETDSHHSLPIVNFSKERLNEIEFYPYKKMFREGLASVMVAHLNVPSIESRNNYPTSISYNVVTNILQKELGFEGLIFTDALNMKGASNFIKDDGCPLNPGEIDLDAFLAGNDILLFSENVPRALENICFAIQDGTITEDRLAHSVKKILKYKYSAGLNKYKPIELKNITSDINPVSNDALQYQLYENAVTVIKNANEILPIKNLTDKIAYVKLGDDVNSSFVTTLKKYTAITEVSNDNIDSLNVQLKTFDKVIIGFHKSDKAWKKQDFTEKELLWLQEIAKNNNVILDVFGRPYSLLPITNFNEIESIIISYQNGDIAQEVSAQIIFGAVGSKGKLPVSINQNFKVNDGIETNKINRLGFTSPENVGMDPKILSQIDLIAKKAIDNKMTPGIQVLVARKGKVIYQKSFGSPTYENLTKVTNSDIYDIASLTKIVSTLPNVMKLYDNKKVTLETKLGTMLPIFQDSDKKDIPFKELLSHYAGLQAWIPFYQATLDKTGMPLEKYYRKSYDSQFSKKVADSLFIRNDYHDTIMKMIIDSKLSLKKEYKYSDFTFIILKEYVERMWSKKLDVISQENFYNSMGMNNTMYNPLEKVADKSIIVPSEIDKYFRHQTLQGYVHDMEAAMEGGVGGHAGIFSNAMDIAKIMQMYIQKGNYGNQQYFSEKTFNDFNTCYFCPEGNRRGLGFDKPQLSGGGATCGCAPMTSFGHTGFTGTMAWADAENEIVYVFLSNRTFPGTNPVNTLSKENIREDIQKVIYDAIVK